MFDDDDDDDDDDGDGDDYDDDNEAKCYFLEIGFHCNSTIWEVPYMNTNMTRKKLFSAGQCPYPLLKEKLLFCVLELEVYLDLKGLEASLLWLSLML